MGQRRLDTDAQLARFSRQILLPQIDVLGQEKLLNATVMIVGLGGLGSAVSLYLAAAGVGRLVLIDHDVVELSNLQRQIAHDTDAIGMEKVASAAQRLRAMNPETEVFACAEHFSAEQIVRYSPTVVVDASDNFATRLEINAAAVSARCPLVIGSALMWSGQLTVIEPSKDHAPCYACLHRGQPVLEQRCAEMGVISPLLGVIGSLQALETMKLILELPTQTGVLLMFEGLSTQPFEQIRYERWARCPHHTDAT